MTINTGTGSISGTPDRASSSTQSAAVTITDYAGNPVAATITFPVVAKGDQTLVGFGYNAGQITFGVSIATLTPSTRALTSLAFSAVPTTVCGVDSGSGALTISAVGTGTITATAPDNANYNRASAVFELVVNEIGTLPLSLAAVAGDNAVNITEVEAVNNSGQLRAHCSMTTAIGRFSRAVAFLTR